jgi:hypothetical protein
LFGHLHCSGAATLDLPRQVWQTLPQHRPALFVYADSIDSSISRATYLPSPSPSPPAARPLPMQLAFRRACRARPFGLFAFATRGQFFVGLRAADAISKRKDHNREGLELDTVALVARKSSGSSAHGHTFRSRVRRAAALSLLRGGGNGFGESTFAAALSRSFWRLRPLHLIKHDVADDAGVRADLHAETADPVHITEDAGPVTIPQCAVRLNREELGEGFSKLRDRGTHGRTLQEQHPR